ncbi:MAG: hypothetical protein ACM34E_11675 [Acidobacteriota bacterium]
MAQDQSQLSPVHTVVTLSCTAAALLVASFVIRFTYHPDLAAIQKQAASLLNTSLAIAAQPEPLEQALYMSLFPLGLVLLAAFSMVFWAMLRPKSQFPNRMELVPGWILGGGTLVAFYLVSKAGEHLYLRSTLLVRHPTLHFLVFLPLAAWVYHRGRARVLERAFKRSRLVLLGIICLVVFADSFLSANNLPQPYHLNPVVYPLALVLNGEPIGGDALSLYGFFPVYVAPLVTLLGGSITAVGAVFGLLIVAMFVATIGVASLIIVNPFLKICVSCSVPYLCYLCYCPHADPYFQYVPVRMLFPALMLIALAWESRKRRYQRRAFALAAAFATTGLFWNLDSGLACVLSLGGYGAIRLCTTWRASGNSSKLAVVLATKHYVLPGLVGVAGASALFLFLGRVQVHSWPEFFRAMAATRRIAYFGYSFMPLPDGLAPWHAVVLLAGGCCLYALRVFLSHREGLAAFHVAVGVMFLAVLVYHIGRSHVATLFGPLWLAPLAVGLLLDRLDESLSRASVFDFGRVIHLLLLSYMISSPIILLSDLDVFWNAAKSRMAALMRDRASGTTLDVEAAFIKKHSPSGSRIMIFATNREGVLFLASERRPAIRISSSTDLIFRAEHERIMRFLRTNVDTPVFVGTTESPSYSPEITAALANLYHVAETGPRLNLLVRNAKD